jgi:predicted peptidase
MYKNILLLITILLLQTLESEAQLRTSFEKNTYLSGNASMPYRFLKPEQIEDSLTYPLILFLHSEKQAGDDNEKQLNHFIMEFAKNKKRSHYPAFIIAPQLPMGKSWTTAVSGTQQKNFAPIPNKELRSSMDLIRSIAEKYPVDTNRIYIIGISEGGMATWELAMHYGSQISAIVSICATCNSQQIKTLEFSTPVWAFIGANDQRFSASEATALFSDLQAKNLPVKLSVLENQNLNCWNETLNLDLFNWLFAQSK